MSDPMDTYRELMDTRPPLLSETPIPMREWIGRVIQQYGTEAGKLQTLQAEHKALKKTMDSYISTDEMRAILREEIKKIKEEMKHA